MTRILAIDVGKFKSVTCLLNTETNETEFWTMATERGYLLTVLGDYKPELVVVESCGLAGWLQDVCHEQGHEVLVCSPNQEACSLSLISSTLRGREPGNIRVPLNHRCGPRRLHADKCGV
jgi:hypothetical protein